MESLCCNGYGSKWSTHAKRDYNTSLDGSSEDRHPNIDMSMSICKRPRSNGPTTLYCGIGCDTLEGRLPRDRSVKENEEYLLHHLPHIVPSIGEQDTELQLAKSTGLGFSWLHQLVQSNESIGQCMMKDSEYRIRQIMDVLYYLGSNIQAMEKTEQELMEAIYRTEKVSARQEHRIGTLVKEAEELKDDLAYKEQRYRSREELWRRERKKLQQEKKQLEVQVAR